MLESTVNRMGISNSLFVKCDCGMTEFLATGDHPSNDTTPRTIQGKDLNRRIVYGTFEMGVGKEGIAKLCEMLNMPFSISLSTWYEHEEALLKAHKEILEEQLAKNRAEARMQAIQEECITDANDQMIISIPVSFDGSWSKRGYTANHCVGFVISAATGKVLDLEVISKTCSVCSQKKSSLTEDQFEQWCQTHHCEGSYKGSSSSMEMECAKRIWGRSEQGFIRYTWMISDGDSKAYNSIWSIYGACDTCHHYENLQNNDQEYITWKASEDFKKWEEDHLAGTAGCDRVMKLDCIGHVQKRLGKALYEFQKSSVKLSDGKPMHGRNGRLTKAAIEKLKKNYGKAIRDNVKREITTTEERDQAVQTMKTEILAGLFHCLKLPNKERHQFCPPNSWCKYKKGLPCPNKPHHLDKVFEEHLCKIYDRLTDSALLARCLPGYTQNANESINSLVWNKCPKHKWHGRRRVQLAALSAALHFSGGASAKHAIMEKVGLTVSDTAKMEARRRDSERIKQAEKRVQDQHKKYRVARRQAKQHDEDLRIRGEGVTYAAGAFGEIEPCNGPKKRKTTQKTKK